ncbi:MAG TPA: dihydrofolate reductase family protein [Anaerolineales bacterium]|nr:dihydrofolate reductase family protein [Anaerolineales bacterium]HLO31922.1 dihydrofolate reductase family protein [Anaerolineales bacterium]
MMRKVILYVTMSLDGFIASPNNELDWMLPVMDQEMGRDSVNFFKELDGGFMGYPTASGMIPYWSNVAQNPSASKGERDIAEAVNKLHSIIISKTAEKLEWANSELLLIQNDHDLIEGVRRIKQQPGRDLAVPGGVRTAQAFARLGLIDEYVFMVQPVALGKGKSVFTGKVELDLFSAKTYQSGILRLCYRPRLTEQTPANTNAGERIRDTENR